MLTVLEMSIHSDYVALGVVRQRIMVKLGEEVCPGEGRGARGSITKIQHLLCVNDPITL